MSADERSSADEAAAGSSDDGSAGQTRAAAPDGTTGRSGTDGSVLISLRGITKSFGPVRALTKIDLDVPTGQVTALAGDNGAGKSSLIKTISGLWEPDGGQIIWQGRPVRLPSPKAAEALGITTIYQDLALCDNLDIVQNMFLGHEKLRHGLLDEATMELTARRTLDDLRVTTVRSMRQPAGTLSGGQRQSVAVAKAVMSKAKLVIMDEPTASLGVAQTRMVLDLIKRLASQGVTVLMVSHNLNDVFEVADRLAILYLGRMVTTGPVSDFDRQIVVDYMTTGTSTRSHAASGAQGS
jgi:ABC-type sugar transport system ATPase subunit